MKVKTRKFGEIDTPEEKIITMPTGLPGFPGRRRFIIVEREETRPFCWYQSVDDPNLALVIVNPYLFKPDYLVDPRAALKEMSWEADGGDGLILYVVVNISEGVPKKITANLIGPIVVNTQKREAVQMVVYDSPYSYQHPILP